MILFLVFAWIANILSLAVADWIFSGVHIDGFWPLVIGGAVLGIANTIVKPILTILTLPLVIVTLGLFLLVINALMLMLVSALVKGFKVNGFWTALFASLFIAILSIVLNAILYPGPTFTFTAPHGTQV